MEASSWGCCGRLPPLPPRPAPARPALPSLIFFLFLPFLCFMLLLTLLSSMILFYFFYYYYFLSLTNSLTYFCPKNHYNHFLTFIIEPCLVPPLTSRFPHPAHTHSSAGCGQGVFSPLTAGQISKLDQQQELTRRLDCYWNQTFPSTVSLSPLMFPPLSLSPTSGPPPMLMPAAQNMPHIPAVQIYSCLSQHY